MGDGSGDGGRKHPGRESLGEDARWGLKSCLVESFAGDPESDFCGDLSPNNEAYRALLNASSSWCSIPTTSPCYTELHKKWRRRTEKLFK